VNRNMITAVVLAAITVSTAQVYASAGPIKITGSTKTAYERTEENEYKSKSEVKVYMTSEIDDRTTAGLDLKFKNSNNHTANSESNSITLYDVWAESKLNNNMALRLGSQPIEIGKGLWMAANGVTGAMLSAKLDKSNSIRIFAGRDQQEDTVYDAKSHTKINFTNEIQYLAWDNTFEKGTGGLYFGKQDKDKYVAVHGEYEIAPQTAVSSEYINNNHSNTRAYVVELVNGNAKKVGDFKYTLSYMDADAGIFRDANYTDYDDQYTESGFKGVGAAVSYKVSKAGTLTFEKWWGEKTAATDHGTFICSSLKLSTKF
jgi:hypothetical protein